MLSKTYNPLPSRDAQNTYQCCYPGVTRWLNFVRCRAKFAHRPGDRVCTFVCGFNSSFKRFNITGAC